MNRLAELRKKENLSQSELGKIIGAAQNTISNWENENRKIDIDSLRILANYFNVSAGYILGENIPMDCPLTQESLKEKEESSSPDDELSKVKKILKEAVDIMGESELAIVRGTVDAIIAQRKKGTP